MQRVSWRVLAAVGLAVVVAAATGCKPIDDTHPARSAAAPPSSPEELAEQAIQDRLDDRAWAVLANDREEFLATVAPGRAAREQVAWFRRIQRVPIDESHLDVIDLALSPDLDHATATVVETTRVPGFDPAPVVTRHRLVLDAAPGSGDPSAKDSWVVSRDRVSRDQIVTAPWQFPGVLVQQTDWMLLAADRAALAATPDLVTMLDRERRYVGEVTGHSLGGVVIVALSTTDALTAEGLSDEAAVRFAAITTTVPTVSGAEARVVLAPSILGSDPQQAQIVLRHELAHVCFGKALGAVPVWMEEGIAEYTAWYDVHAPRLGAPVISAARGGITRMPPDDPDFYSGSAEQVEANYGTAWWSMVYLSRRYGPAEPYRLQGALAQAHAFTSEKADVVLQDRYGLTADELAAQAGDLIVEEWGRG